MKGFARAGLRFAWDSLAAAALGALAAGAVDAARGGGSALAVLGTLGFAALLAWPALAALALVTRGLWRAWTVDALLAELREDGGATPRLAAGMSYVGLALAAMWTSTLMVVHFQSAATAFKPEVVALVTAVVSTLTAAALMLLSRPALALLTRGWRAVDRVAKRRLRRSVVTPRVLVGVAMAGGAAAMVITWFAAIQPKLAYYDLGLVAFVATGLGATVGAHVVLRRLATRPARALGITGAALAASVVVAAIWIRHSQPLVVLEIWARDGLVASDVIELTQDLESLRGDINLAVARPTPRPGAPHPSVLLITIDTVREDHTPLGGGAAKMPTLADLGRRGTVFEHAYSPGNVTRRSVPSIASGVAPSRMKGKVAGWALRLDPRHIMLAERFRAAGYVTAGFFCCASFWSPQHHLGINRGLDHLYIDPAGENIAAAYAAWAATRKAGDPPSFVWLHFIEAHNWTKEARGIPGDKGAQYDYVLGRIDTFLTTVMKATDALPADLRPLIAVTADHGEALGQHGHPYHSTDLYDSQIHVPMLIAGPGVSARVVPEVVGGVDLAPTLLDLAGFAPPAMPDMDGRSLAELATGARVGTADDGVAFSVMTADRSVPKGMRTVIRGGWKLIEGGGKVELYDLHADPREQHDLAATRLDQVKALTALLTARTAADHVSPFTAWRQ